MERGRRGTVGGGGVLGSMGKGVGVRVWSRVGRAAGRPGERPGWLGWPVQLAASP